MNKSIGNIDSYGNLRIKSLAEHRAYIVIGYYAYTLEHNKKDVLQ